MKQAPPSTCSPQLVFAFLPRPQIRSHETTVMVGCGPCRLVNPVLEEIDSEYGSGRPSALGHSDAHQVESLSVVVINTDEADLSVVNAWGVESIPTLLLVR